MQNDELLQRVKIVMVKKHGGTVAKWAEVLGMPQTTVDKKMRGVQKMSLDMIMRILEIYPDISAEWLLRGTEPKADIENGTDGIKMAMLCESQSKDLQWLRKKINQQAEELNDVTELLEQKNKLIESLTKG